MDGCSGTVLDDVAGNDGYDGGGEIDGNKEKADADGGSGNIRRRGVDFVDIWGVERLIGDFE